MAILHSCCCWRSVRKGSIACGIYTMIYFLLTTFAMAVLLRDELKYYHTNYTVVPQHSILEPDTTSTTSILFTVLTLSTSSCGIMTAMMLLYGVFTNRSAFLIPWVITVGIAIGIDVGHCIYLSQHTLQVNPLNAILFTFDFFLGTLNVYAILCVISQYQELRAGRGRACDENFGVPNVQYSTQPTATTYPSTRRPVTYHETRPTPTQSPTGTCPHTSPGTDDTSPNVNAKGRRKSVKFPDASPVHNDMQLLEPWTIDVKSPIIKGTDTAPLIESSKLTTENNK